MFFKLFVIFYFNNLHQSQMIDAPFLRNLLQCFADFIHHFYFVLPH